jgi:hypothetical protein
MNPYSSKFRTTLLLILIPLIFSLGCQWLQQAVPAPTTPESGEKSFETNIIFGSGPFYLTDTTAGLADLSSYKATLTLSFDGTKTNQPSKWSKTYVMLVSKEPAARQLTIEKTGDIADLSTVLMAEMDGADYERRGQESCLANAIVEGNSLGDQMEPAGFLAGVFGADTAGSETVNGVKADHYTFDERALGQTNLAKSTGDLWVASEGGYIVKYLLSTKATADYFGEGIEGTLTKVYELTDVNKPVTMELPADCPAGMVNAPKLPDASNILNMPSVLSYDTASSLADATAFYQKQIPDLGWKLLGTPDISDTSALLTFTQGDQEMTVIITAATEGTNVQIALDSAQK